MGIEILSKDQRYLRYEDALIHSLDELANCQKKDLPEVKSRYVANLTIMADYLFFDQNLHHESLRFYKEAHRNLGAWPMDRIHADARYQNLIKANEKAKQSIVLSTNPNLKPSLTRLQAERLADIGHYFYNKSLYVEAMNYYAQAREILPDDPSILNQLGICLIQLGKFMRAIHIFELMERRNVNSNDKALAFYNLSYCYRLNQEWQKAEQAIKKSLKYNPEDCNSLKILQELRDYISKSSYMNYPKTLFSNLAAAKPSIQTSEQPQAESTLPPSL